MASGQMKKIAPCTYWAGKSFQHKGVWIWTGKRNIRILPWIYVLKED